MTSVAQAAAAASILVGLVSIPAVSKTAVEPSMSQQMPNISDEATTRQVTKKVGTDGFSAEIQTAFSEFTTDITPEEADTTVQSAGSKLHVEKSAEETSWKLSTSAGSLTLTQSPEKVEEVVETPEGTLTRVSSGGTIKTSFEGADRESVEDSRQSLKQLMEQKKQEIDEKRERFGNTTGSDSGIVDSSVELNANESTGSGYGNNTMEHVVLVNNGDELDLEGWKLSNNNGEFVGLPDYTVSSGESVRIYSNDVDAEGITDTGLTWENGGDTAKLKNSNGELVAEKSY